MNFVSFWILFHLFETYFIHFRKSWHKRATSLLTLLSFWFFWIFFETYIFISQISASSVLRSTQSTTRRATRIRIGRAGRTPQRHSALAMIISLIGKNFENILLQKFDRYFYRTSYLPADKTYQNFEIFIFR